MSSIPREALNTRASKPGVIMVASSTLSSLARAISSFESEMSADLVHYLGGRVAQHPLGADVENLDNALRVGGDAGEVGAVEDRALQGPGLELGADEQVADDGVLRVAQRGDGHHGGESAPVLADVGQLVDVFD